MSLPTWTPTKSLAARATKRKSNFYTAINIWPFVSVMTALLIAFMTVAAPYDVDGMPIDRPFARNATPQPRSLREDSIHLVIARDGKFFFSSSGGTHWTQIEIEELPSLLRNASKNTVEKKIYLDADARCRYSDVKIAINQLCAAGITSLVILTQKPPTPSPPRQ